MNLPEKIRKRLPTLMVLIAIVIFPTIGSYWAFIRLIDLFLYKQLILFNRFDVFALLSPLFLYPLVILGGYFLFTLNQAPMHLQVKIGKLIIFSFFFAIVSTMVFSFCYPYLLEEKGYIRCNGIPLNSMPGMVVKYAANEALCRP
ncbi:hypothetical protein Ppb6_01420 [Photorhabdus australis subsp. thailandensis]|uniref:DUF1240 domain-containing protein n=1 Tax=Photorhabdus australis subsp. thailandensis TaxID=2805096 RepID=A0A1C0U622_9GAMM|nr:hypothetical protein Ppb6_01420 [Photorhabdus australis subsp. thailandensis]